MIDEKMFNLLRDQLSAERAEKEALLQEVIGFREEVHLLRRELSAMKKSQDEKSDRLQIELAKSNVRIDQLLQLVRNKEELIAELQRQLKNEQDKNNHNRGKRFAPTTEQAALLNNRTKDTRSDEKSQFDGKEVAVEAGPEQIESARKELHPRPKPSPEPSHVDEVVMHNLGDYYNLPDGAHYMTRDGKVDTGIYVYIEYRPAKVVKHVYEVARVALADGETIVSTLPDECRLAAAKGTPFTAELLAFIYTQKYAYHASVNTVKKMLRDMGAVFSKSTLNRYYQMGTDALMNCLRDVLNEETGKSDYLMVDETCEVVAVEDKKTGETHYRKKYLWAFFDKVKKLVSYVYEKGSRSREVALKFLKDFCGCISTDGYVAYRIFDDAEKHPDITHVGCWVHARRYAIESLSSDHKNSLDIINTIAELFDVEYTCKVARLSDEERKMERLKKSVPVLTRLYAMVRTMSKDAALMANDMMARTVKYILNQWNSLRNFILNGKVEISNNLCEQRMKAIKLCMKNCQNIGSEIAAERQAFMHSLFESCSLNKINPMDYFTDLFRHYGELNDHAKKVAYLPCYFHNKT